MRVLERKAVKHNPWFVFSLWVILVAIGMLEAWAILLHDKNYPTWEYVLCLIGIIFVGLCWLYGMFVSAKKQFCKNKNDKYHQRYYYYGYMFLTDIVMFFY